MKFFHLSDLHLGKRVNEFSMIDNQADILQKIVMLAKENNPDAVLIAGDVYDKSMDEKFALKSKGVNGGILWYYWLCLSELPFDIAKTEIVKYKDKILIQLNRSCVMNSESDKINHPVIICVIRNALARFPEYAYIKDHKPYINEKDGRLYFDLNGDIDHAKIG